MKKMTFPISPSVQTVCNINCACGGKKSAFVVVCDCVCVGGHGYTDGT